MVVNIRLFLVLGIFSVRISEVLVENMSQRFFVTIKTGAFALVSMSLLAGCSGTSTYGTGKSQEAQLFEDLTSIASMGSGKKKKKINYISRPKLVKPPIHAGLPTPAESVETQSGYYPVNPEAKRQRLLRQIKEAEENGEALPEEVIAARRASIASVNPRKTNTHDLDRGYHEQSSEEKARLRKEFLRRRGQSSATKGAAPRKWLTEPPKDYRTPAESAEVGKIGEKETDPRAFKKKKSLFGWLKK